MMISAISGIKKRRSPKTKGSAYGSIGTAFIALLMIIGFLCGFNRLPFSFAVYFESSEYYRSVIISAAPFYGLSGGASPTGDFLPTTFLSPQVVYGFSGGGYAAVKLDAPVITAEVLPPPLILTEDMLALVSDIPESLQESQDNTEEPPSFEFEEEEPKEEPKKETEEEPDMQAAVPAVVDLSKPLVLIYCTHNAETYYPTDGADKLEGKNAGVYFVAQALCDELLSMGISVIISDTIHDYPDWSASYQNSLNTIEEMRKKYPSLEVFIDVHRDAPEGYKDHTVVLDNQRFARIMFVVGSEKRVPLPTWAKNLSFAQELANNMEADYPGILRGVKIQSGRYNQHVSDKCILVEMGTNKNSLQEAKNTATALAQALSKILAN